MNIHSIPPHNVTSGNGPGSHRAGGSPEGPRLVNASFMTESSRTPAAWSHRPFHWARTRVVDATGSLFSHGPYPLAHTLTYRGDPGLFGPGSATWMVVGDTSVFVGGIRALLIQAAHPEVAAGVFDHSRYRNDPLGRLTRTASYVTATSYGAMPEVEAAVASVRDRHQAVRGRSHRGRPYSAAEPGLDAWVHNALTDSFLTAYRVYGASNCSQADGDRYVSEQTRVGRLLGADPLPETAQELTDWIVNHEQLGPSPGSHAASRFLRRPPLSPMVRAAYGLLFRAAVATLPLRIRQILGLSSATIDIKIGRMTVMALRQALLASPDWQLALIRTASPPPPGVRFRHTSRSRILRLEQSEGIIGPNNVPRQS
jgi:uncharacterized protein (DUF2236 family)